MLDCPPLNAPNSIKLDVPPAAHGLALGINVEKTTKPLLTKGALTIRSP